MKSESTNKILSYISLILITSIYSSSAFGQSKKQHEEITKLFKSGCAIQHENIDSIKAYAEEISRIAEGSKDTDIQLMNSILYGHWLMKNNKIDSAKTLLHLSLQTIENQYKDIPAQIYSQNLRLLGELYYLNSEYLLSKKYCLMAQREFYNQVKVNNDNEALKYELKLYHLLGSIEGKRSNYQSSLKYFMESFKRKQYMKSPEADLLPDYINIAVTYTNIGRNTEAIDYGRKAISLAKKINSNRAEIVATLGIASAYIRLQLFDSAEYYYDKALYQSYETGAYEYVSTIRQNKAHMHSEAGEYEEALTIIKQNLASNSTNHEILIHSKVTAASCYLQLGMYDSAIAIAKEAIRSSTPNESNINVRIDLTQTIATAYEQKGNYKDALFYHKLNKIHYDSLMSVDSERELSEIYVQVETIQKQHEIDLVRKEQQITHAENEQLWMSILAGSTIALLIILLLLLFHLNQKKLDAIKSIELQAALEKREGELRDQTLRIIALNNGISEIEEGLRKISKGDGNASGREIQQVINTITVNRVMEREWINFDVYFGNVHKGFHDRLKKSFPSLTISEGRLASLIRMNLTNSEIATLLHVENNTVKMSKYRLKKKVGLSEKEDIYDYLLKI